MAGINIFETSGTFWHQKTFYSWAYRVFQEKKAWVLKMSQLRILCPTCHMVSWQTWSWSNNFAKRKILKMTSTLSSTKAAKCTVHSSHSKLKIAEKIINLTFCSKATWAWPIRTSFTESGSWLWATLCALSQSCACTYLK